MFLTIIRTVLFVSLFLILQALLILRPRLDAQVVHRHRAEGIDEGAGQTGVGDERNVEVDGRTAYLVAVTQLARRQVLGDVDHHVDFLR